MLQNGAPEDGDRYLQRLRDFLDSVYRLSAAAWAEVGPLVRIQHLKRHEVLQPTGHSCRTVYFLLEGCMQIFYYREGKEVTEDFELAPELVVRAESLFTGQPSPKGIQALTPATVAAIPSAPLFALFKAHREVETLMRLLTERAYVRTLRRLEGLQFLTAEERYQRLQETYPGLEGQIALKYIASYLGITQVSLSRLRAR